MCGSLQGPLEQTLPQTTPWRGAFPPCAATRCPSAVAPCPAGHCLWPQQLPLGTITSLGSQEPCRALLHLSLMPGVSSVRCQRSLRPRASLPLALPSPGLRFHWNGVKRRPVHRQGLERISRSAGNACQAASAAPSLLPGFLWGL